MRCITVFYIECSVRDARIRSNSNRANVSWPTSPQTIVLQSAINKLLRGLGVSCERQRLATPCVCVFACDYAGRRRARLHHANSLTPGERAHERVQLCTSRTRRVQSLLCRTSSFAQIRRISSGRERAVGRTDKNSAIIHSNGEGPSKWRPNVVRRRRRCWWSTCTERLKR